MGLPQKLDPLKISSHTVVKPAVPSDIRLVIKHSVTVIVDSVMTCIAFLMSMSLI